ncbi:fasciclin domain-containing protein [Deinococcus detaillensis]|uniref:Fasciclin domain-containing protein n=1 Tax=Deinococcus detaillensis TaxID=2592048 RepID=A0A553V1M1_9DEIO|nr:fasciclin domain-containing protein [Deinococcus detaillensis]TSA86121.1 fasciclin domain-containing protein [Deinococcus detaillensis]
MLKKTLLLTTALVLAPSAFAAGETPTLPNNSIAGIVVSNPDFSTLLAAVKAAGLVDTLNGYGPFTVFAPTNAAFAKVPADQLKALLNDPAKLKAVLLYHLVSGRVMAADVVTMTSAKSLQGSPLNIMVNGSTVMVNDATVTATDISATNGVIHVIDTVLLPPN